MLPRREKTDDKKFHLPYINAKIFMPLLCVAAFVLVYVYVPGYFSGVFSITSENAAKTVPMLVFFVLCIVLAVLSVLKNLSLIPVLGLLSCCYLLTGMEAANWMWFSTWLMIGLVVYFMYGFRKSKLARK
jgi:hypothetical protein